jgi:hypothetical protein
MGLEEKPYRVYRGGRVKGKVPTVPRPERERRQPGRNGRPPLQRYPGTGPTPRRIRWPRKRWLGVIPVVLIALLTIWAVASYLAVQSGVETANKRLPRPATRALSPQNGSVLSSPTHVLLLGTDHSTTAARRGLEHTDSIQLIRRARKEHHRIAGSVFVNPLQFGPKEDFERYPRDEVSDVRSRSARSAGSACQSTTSRSSTLRASPS